MDDNDQNKGYYQELDDFRAIDSELDRDEQKPRAIKHRNELSYKDPKYDEIADKHDSTTKNGRIKFCQDRNKIHAERQEQFKNDIASGKYKYLPPSEVFCKCRNCGGGFVAKAADRKRGWARFCSKSCKAQGY